MIHAETNKTTPDPGEEALTFHLAVMLGLAASGPVPAWNKPTPPRLERTRMANATTEFAAGAS